MTFTSPGKSGFNESTLSPSKKRYVADTLDVDVVKKIKQNEVELRDRNTVLRGVKPVVSFPRCCFADFWNLRESRISQPSGPSTLIS